MSTKNAINGSVQSQGIKLDVKDWLDMGSPNWKATTDKDKAAAYQAVIVCGWTDDGLRAFMIKEFAPRIDEAAADFTLEILRDLAEEYPIEQVNIYDVKSDNPVFRKHGQDGNWKLK